MEYKKSFYFLRHGQTDSNVSGVYSDDANPPLNSRGKEQSTEVKNLIKTLDIATVCHSPLSRVIETMELCSDHLECERVEVSHLRECSLSVWMNMVKARSEKDVKAFVKQVIDGLSHSLTFPGPVLIIAHGGVHWAICQHLEISKDHEWYLKNCGLVEFLPEPNNSWSAKIIE